MSEAVGEAGHGESTARDTAALVLAGLSLVMGIVQVFYLPFAFGPLALISLVVAVMLSPKHGRLYTIASAVITVGFVVGASLASGSSNPLY
jgi:hypothetical protein